MSGPDIECTTDTDEDAVIDLIINRSDPFLLFWRTECDEDKISLYFCDRSRCFLCLSKTVKRTDEADVRKTNR